MIWMFLALGLFFLESGYVHAKEVGSISQIDQNETGWREEEGQRVYFDKDGQKAIGMVEIDGISYYFDDAGYMKTGFVEYNNHRYYFDKEGKRVEATTRNIDGNWYRFSEDGTIVDLEKEEIVDTDKGRILLLDGRQKYGWHLHPDGTWTYWKPDRSGIQSVGEWCWIQGFWYYFDDAGKMVEGFYTTPNGKHYLFINGAMQMRGWKLYQGNWYYVEGEEVLVSTWKQVNGEWYYLKENGIYATGSLDIGGRTFWFAEGGSGRMLSGWQLRGQQWYYLDYYAGLLRDTWKYDRGNWYFLDGEGKALQGWHQIGSAWYEFEGGGSCRMKTGWTMKEGGWYYLEPSGARFSGGWKYIRGVWYFFDENGRMKTGWIFWGNSWYYLDESGAMATHVRWIDGTYYGFSDSGAMLTKDIFYLLGVPNYNQYAYGAPVGCEGVSLYQALQYKGKIGGISLRSFLNDLPRSWTPYEGFVGSPFVESRDYTAIFPQPLARYGARYGYVADISGASVEQLYAEVRQGNPVVVYVTIGYAQPAWGYFYFGWGLYNNHAVTLDGYDYARGRVHLSDPISGSVWVSMSTFSNLYNQRKFAVVVK